MQNKEGARHWGTSEELTGRVLDNQQLAGKQCMLQMLVLLHSGWHSVLQTAGSV